MISSGYRYAAFKTEIHASVGVLPIVIQKHIELQTRKRAQTNFSIPGRGWKRNAASERSFSALSGLKS